MIEVWSVVSNVFLFIWNSFTLWLNNLFIAPSSNYEIFKILVPVYIGLFLAELFQEKKGTSRGNAMTNAVIVLWGGVDFFIINAKDGMGSADIAKLVIALAIILYGVYIIIEGYIGNEMIKYIGRVREVSYFIMVFAPIYYTDAVLSAQYIFGAIAFFYLFYMTIEVVDKFIPDPKALVADMKEAASVNLLQTTSKEKPI